MSGMAEAASRSVIKLSSKLHDFTLLSLGFLFTLPFYIVWLFFAGLPVIEHGFWVAIALHVPLLTIAMVLMVEAHKASTLAKTMPYMALTPMWLLIVTPFMSLFFPELEKSSPTIIGAGGVLVLVVGLWILNIQKNQKHFFDPIRVFWNDRGSRLIFFVSIILSFAASLDLVALKNASVPFYLFVDSVLVIIIMAFLILLYSTLKIKRILPFSPQGFWKQLFFFGIFIAVTGILHNLAFSWIPVVSYVIAAKRAGSIIFGVLALGLILGVLLKHPQFQEEKKNIRYSIPGTLIAVLGMIIIIVWGKA